MKSNIVRAFGIFCLSMMAACQQQKPTTPAASEPATTAASRSEKSESPAPSITTSTSIVSTSAKAPEEIDLKVVKYPELVNAVKAHRGKIVVVDIWSSTCIPCMKEFPHLVEIYKKHGKDNVVCISVTVDEVKRREAALKFLKSAGATFENFLLDETDAKWQEKFDIKSVPAVFVINRNSERERKFDGDDPNHEYSYADVVKLVEELISRGK